MVRLEYRLLDAQQGYPVLYHYDSIDKDEVSLRFACDYFVKERTVYEKTSAAIERDTYVIYVKPAEDEKAVDYSDAVPLRWGRVQLEVREYKEGTELYPLIHTYQFLDDEDALLHLQANYLYLQEQEWEKTSTEVDEDRRVYIYYAQRT